MLSWFQLKVTKFYRVAPPAVQQITQRAYFADSGVSSPATSLDVEVSVNSIFHNIHAVECRRDVLELLRREIVCESGTWEGEPWEGLYLHISEADFQRIYPRLVSLFGERAQWSLMTLWHFPTVSGRNTHRFCFDCSCEQIRFLGFTHLAYSRNTELPIESFLKDYLRFLRGKLPNRHSLEARCARSFATSIPRLVDIRSLPLTEELQQQVLLRTTQTTE